VLSAQRLKWHAITCSALCGEARRQKRPRRRGIVMEATSQNPPILAVTLMEAADRIGVSHQMAHNMCVEHGIGRLYGDGRCWLTLTELRALTVRPWIEQKK
jgi:hypothetical protein